MPFVNELVPPEDQKKYGITEDSSFFLTDREHWTVDRERDMFLMRRAGGGPESEPGVTSFAFYWHGHLLDVRLLTVDRGGDPHGGHGWEHVRLLGIERMASDVRSQFEEIVRDFKEALIARRGRGIYSRRTSYEVKLDVDGGE